MDLGALRVGGRKGEVGVAEADVGVAEAVVRVGGEDVWDCQTLLLKLSVHAQSPDM
jgi:hypothetical protein